MSETPDNITPLHPEPEQAAADTASLPVCAVTLFLLPDGSAKWQCHGTEEGTQRDADENDARRLCREVGDYLTTMATARTVVNLQMATAQQMRQQAAGNGNGKRGGLHVPRFFRGR